MTLEPVAIYGAVVSTAVAVWNIYREFTNRGRLRVSVYPAGQTAAGLGIIAADRVAYSITNAGRQAIWLRQIGGTYSKDAGKVSEFLITTAAQLPRKLEPGESFLEGNGALADLIKEGYAPTAMGAWDTLGRFYRAPKRDLDRVIRSARALPK